MELREAEYFITIAHEGSLTRAAERLYVTQPTLTKYLQRLETEAGVPLFQRVGHRLRLTYAGERCLYYAERLRQLNLELTNELADIVRNDAGSLRIGMPPFRCSFVMPAVLPEFHRLYPNVAVTFMEESSAKLDAALLSGDIDLAFYNLSEPVPQLEYEVLERDCVCAILPREHPLARTARPAEDGGLPWISLRDLAEETFILQNRTQRLGRYILHTLRELDIRPKKVLESSNIRAAGLLAASGYGVSFMSGGLLRHFEARDRCAAFRLTDATLPMDFVAAHRAGSYLPRCAGDLVELVKERC